jgi:nucleotide-binding universal stress UspA family protein
VETIVCGIDRSPGAQEALRIAERLRRRLGLRVVAVHVVDAFARRSPENGIVVRQARERGDRLVEQLLAERELGELDRRIELGDPAERLAAVALEEGAELIVIGSQPHGRRRRAAFRGRLAAELAETTSCPVLVAPPRTAPAPGDERPRARVGSA